MIQRTIEQQIIRHLKPGQVSLIYGARQVGKTTLVQSISTQLGLKTLYVNGDDLTAQEQFSSQRLSALKNIIGNSELLIIDEAQRIPNIGINIKLMVDSLPNLRMLVTGSSSLDLASKVKEPLTGRTRTYHLPPLSITELSSMWDGLELESRKTQLLTYGNYPAIVLAPDNVERQRKLTELTESYLYKDVLEMGLVNKVVEIRKLLQLIAYQIGQEVSLNELANTLSIDKKTVGRYLALLEQSFVLFSLSSLSRNLRTEIRRNRKYYFWDLGVRNALINNFDPIDIRPDRGHMWENFLIIERQKNIMLLPIPAFSYFWRLSSGAEIDYIEERGQSLQAFEVKWGNKLPSWPEAWKRAYPDASWSVVNQTNWLDFIKIT